MRLQQCCYLELTFLASMAIVRVSSASALSRWLLNPLPCLRSQVIPLSKQSLQYGHQKTQASCASSRTSRTSKRLERLGIGPDGKPLPVANKKRIFPRMYPVLVVNQDGSTYTARYRATAKAVVFKVRQGDGVNTKKMMIDGQAHSLYPYRIVTLPLDPSTLSAEEREARERKREAAKARVYVEEELEEEEEAWDQTKYRDLISKT